MNAFNMEFLLINLNILNIFMEEIVYYIKTSAAAFNIRNLTASNDK